VASQGSSPGGEDVMLRIYPDTYQPPPLSIMGVVGKGEEVTDTVWQVRRMTCPTLTSVQVGVETSRKASTRPAVHLEIKTSLTAREALRATGI